MEQKNDLSSVRVGDKLYHVRYGECEVVGIDISSRYPIRVRCSDVKSAWFTFDGKEDERDALPTLFLSKPTIIFPPPPKEVEISRWVGFVRCGEEVVPRNELFQTEDEANCYADKDPSIPRAVYVYHKYRK